MQGLTQLLVASVGQVEPVLAAEARAEAVVVAAGEHGARGEDGVDLSLCLLLEDPGVELAGRLGAARGEVLEAAPGRHGEGDDPEPAGAGSLVHGGEIADDLCYGAPRRLVAVEVVDAAEDEHMAVVLAQHITGEAPAHLVDHLAPLPLALEAALGALLRQVGEEFPTPHPGVRQRVAHGYQPVARPGLLREHRRGEQERCGQQGQARGGHGAIVRQRRREAQPQRRSPLDPAPAGRVRARAGGDPRG